MEKIAEENRVFLRNKLNCEEIITAKQTHSDHIKIINENDYFYNDTDALISNKENSLLLMNFADCVPIILYSRNDNIGAIVHAGWRGTANEILKKTIIKMRDELNVQPKDITALIGPSIGKCCFETGEDVFNQLIKNKTDEKLFKEKNSKYYIDLKELNNIQLKELGVENIDYDVAPIDADVIIVDEMSMVDILLMNYLLKAVYLGTKLKKKRSDYF